MNSPDKLNDSISTGAERYLEFMRGVDILTRSVADVPVIDIDFAPSTDAQPGSQVSFDHRIDAFNQTLNGEVDAQLMRRNLRAAKLAMNVVTRKLVIGENLDYDDFVAGTTGIRPRMVPETSEDENTDSIESQRQRIEATVQRLGYRFDPSDRDKFNAEHAIPAEQKEPVIEGLVESAKEFIRDTVGKRMAGGLRDIDIKVAEEKDTYQGYFGRDKDGRFCARFNSNPLLKFSSLQEMAAIVHELTHAVSATHKQRLIDNDELSPAAGVLPVFSPMYFQEEVAARAMEEKFLAKMAGTSHYADYAYQTAKYFGDVNTNMIIMANSGHSPEEVAEYGQARLPFDEPAKLDKSAQLYADNLVYKTVFAIDSEAIRVGRAIAQLPPKEMKAAVIRLCSEIVPTEEILAYGQTSGE